MEKHTISKTHQSIMDQIQVNTYVISNYGIDNINVMVTVHWNHLLQNFEKKELIAFAEVHKDFLSPEDEWICNRGKFVDFYNIGILKKFTDLQNEDKQT